MKCSLAVVSWRSRSRLNTGGLPLKFLSSLDARYIKISGVPLKSLKAVVESPKLCAVWCNESTTERDLHDLVCAHTQSARCIILCFLSSAENAFRERTNSPPIVFCRVRHAIVVSIRSQHARDKRWFLGLKVEVVNFPTGLHAVVVLCSSFYLLTLVRFAARENLTSDEKSHHKLRRICADHSCSPSDAGNQRRNLRAQIHGRKSTKKRWVPHHHVDQTT